LFLDVADTTLKTKDSSGTVASIGGGAGASAPVAVTSGTLNVTSSHNGKLITNAGATSDIILSLASVATLGNAVEFSVVNEENLVRSAIVANYRMNNDWTDSSGNGNTGTAEGGATFSSSAKFGSHCGDFDGTNDYVSADNLTADDFFDGAHSYSVWIKLKSGSPDGAILGASSDTAAVYQYSILYFHNSNKKFGVQVLNDATSNSVESTNTYTNDTNWHHLVATVNASGHIVFYVDGSSCGSDSTNTVTLPDVNTFTLGAFGWPTNTVIAPIPAYLDDVAVFNRVLTADEVTHLYNSGTGRQAINKITITPNAADQLPNTASVGNSIQSSHKNDCIKLRTTDDGLIVVSVYPAVANFVDLLD